MRLNFPSMLDGMVHQEGFVVDSALGNLDEQFEEALLSATEAINSMNSDMDLSSSGLEINSLSGKTLGIQDFEVQDNAGISMGSFSGFLEGDTVGFTVTSGGVDSNVSVDLTGVDTSDDAQVATAFYDAIHSALDGDAFVVENDVSTNSVMIRTLNGSGITLQNVSNIAAAPTIVVTAQPGSNIAADSTLTFNGLDGVAVDVVAGADTLGFHGQWVRCLCE